MSQTKQAQTFAQHLADKQWAQPVQGYTGPRTPLQHGGDGHRSFHSGGVRRGASQGLAQQGGGSGRHPDRGVAVAHRGQQKEVAGHPQPGAHSRSHPAGMATGIGGCNIQWQRFHSGSKQLPPHQPAQHSIQIDGQNPTAAPGEGHRPPAAGHTVWFPRRSFHIPTSPRFSQTTGKGGTHRRLLVCPPARLASGV